MTEQSPAPSTPTSTTARFIPLLVFGIMLNTIGIALRLSSPAGYVLMGAGMLLILIGLIRMLAARSAASSPGPASSPGDVPPR